MDNKEALKQNNSRIDINNTDLSSILITINNLPVQKEIKLQEKSITPSTTEQEITADEGYTGLSKVTVAGDENLIADNIKEGTSIFGVEGNAKTTSAKITDASYLFYEGRRIDYVNEIFSLFEGITSVDNMFFNCSSLTELDVSKLDTSQVTSMKSMFYGCRSLTELDVSKWDTSKVTNMNGMFYSCSKLTKLDVSKWDTSKVTDMNSTFNSCGSLTELDVSKWDTSKVTDMGNMFGACRKITSLDLSNFDMSKVIRVGYMFSSLDNGLINLKSFKNLGKGYTQKSNNYSNYKLDLSYSKSLTKESLLDVITNGLYDLNLTYDVANGGTLYTQQLVLGSTNLAKLTAEEIAIATNKGWVVS